MPRRLWILSVVMVLAVAVGYFVLVRASAPRDTPATDAIAAADASNSDARSGAVSTGSARQGAATEPDGPEPFPGIVVAEAVVGPDGVARIETPFVVPPGPVPDPAFQAEIDAWAETVRSTVPVVDGLTTLDSIEVEGREITFDYRIAIDLRAYTLPQDKPEMLIPGLDGWLCDGNTCFQIKPEFAQIVCESPVGPLLERGAAGIYKYRDTHGLPIATSVVTGADCDE